MGVAIGMIAAIVLWLGSIFFIGNLAEQQGYNKGWWAGVTALCEDDLKGVLMELPSENWVECVQYEVPAPQYPSKP